jgi:hypothetical protein
MFTQPDIRLDISDQIQRERMAVAERHRIAAAVASHNTRSATPRRPRRLVRAVLALAGARILG